MTTLISTERTEHRRNAPENTVTIGRQIVEDKILGEQQRLRRPRTIRQRDEQAHNNLKNGPQRQASAGDQLQTPKRRQR